MTVKASISLTDSQDAFARKLVAEGRYPSLSAVLQQGLELLRRDVEAHEAEIEGLRELIRRRREGPFMSADAFRERTDRMLAEEAARYLGEDDEDDDGV